jgi:predicted SprT family Zn-dependent metalloprotease
MAITSTEYQALEEAFRYFNDELFGGKLSPCLITLQSRARSRGYYSPKGFSNRNTDATTDEISLNPVHFEGRSDEEVLSVLVHEMVHKYQDEHGNPGRGRYHNREWAELMMVRGLMPSCTGEPGGKKTGQRVSHYIIKGGLFQLACGRLLDSGFKLNWESSTIRKPGKTKDRNEQKIRAEIKNRSKTKFTCPRCRQNAWAKSSATLICGVCYGATGEIIPMKDKRAEDDGVTPGAGHSSLEALLTLPLCYVAMVSPN